MSSQVTLSKEVNASKFTCDRTKFPRFQLHCQPIIDIMRHSLRNSIRAVPPFVEFLYQSDVSLRTGRCVELVLDWRGPYATPASFKMKYNALNIMVVQIKCKREGGKRN